MWQKKQTFIKNKELSTGFTYSACGSSTKHRETIQKFRETDNLKHWCRTELDKAYFVHDVAYSESKDLAKRTISDKILRDRAYEITRKRNYDWYQRALANMVYEFLDKKTEPGKSLNEQLAEELHKTVTKKFKRRKIYASFKDNI